MIRTVIKEPIAENSSVRLTGQLQDETGVGIPSGSLTTLALTLYDHLTGTPLNARLGQNIKNANEVTIDGLGNLIYSMLPADNAIVGTENKEWHVALFEGTWSAGAKGFAYEIVFPVMNLTKVT